MAPFFFLTEPDQEMVQAAAFWAYGGWLAFLAISIVFPFRLLLLAPAFAVLPGCIGRAGLSIVLSLICANMHHLSPHI